jgi:hypothetical protein
LQEETKVAEGFSTAFGDLREAEEKAMKMIKMKMMKLKC